MIPHTLTSTNATQKQQKRQAALLGSVIGFNLLDWHTPRIQIPSDLLVILIDCSLGDLSALTPPPFDFNTLNLLSLRFELTTFVLVGVEPLLNTAAPNADQLAQLA